MVDVIIGIEWLDTAAAMEEREASEMAQKYIELNLTGIGFGIDLRDQL